MKGETRRIFFEIEMFEPDPVQYKPGKPTIKAENLYVALDVPEKYFLKDASGLPRGANCLTKEGFRKVRSVLSGLEEF